MDAFIHNQISRTNNVDCRKELLHFILFKPFAVLNSYKCERLKKNKTTNNQIHYDGERGGGRLYKAKGYRKLATTRVIVTRYFYS